MPDWAPTTTPSPIVTWSATPTCPASTTPRPSRDEPEMPTCATSSECSPISHVVADLHQVVDLGAPAARSCRRRWRGRSWCWRRSRRRPRSRTPPTCGILRWAPPSKAKPKPSAPSTAPACTITRAAEPHAVAQAHVRVDAPCPRRSRRPGRRRRSACRRTPGPITAPALDHARAARRRRVGIDAGVGRHHRGADRRRPAAAPAGGTGVSSSIRACCGACAAQRRGRAGPARRAAPGTRPARDARAASR